MAKRGESEKLVPFIRLPYDVTAAAVLGGALFYITGLAVSSGDVLIAVLAPVLGAVTWGLALAVSIRRDQDDSLS